MNISISFPSLFDSTTEKTRSAKHSINRNPPGSSNSIDMKKLYDYHDPSCRIPTMPPKMHKKALAVDLDETLIHSSDTRPKSYVQCFKLSDDFYFNVRPNAVKFLKKASKIFDLFIFTASEKTYADPIIDLIYPAIDEKHRLYRDSCKIIDGNICKDLRFFERNLRKVILVDDKVDTFTFFPNNTISINPWYDDPNDNTLLNVVWPLLKKCEAATDVRGVIEQYNISQSESSKKKKKK